MAEPAAVTRQRLALRPPEADSVPVLRDLDARGIRFDLYAPPGRAPGALAPGLVFVSGYPDSGMERVVGRRLKEWASYADWARLSALSGIAAVLYSPEDPAADARVLVEHLRAHGAALGVDPDRLGLFACSGNVPSALGLLFGEPGRFFRAAALLYGYTLDLDGATGVADAAKAFGFANPCAGRVPAELPPRTPLFLVRAGRDALPGLNDALERFAARALAANLPVELLNLPDAPHGFDSAEDTDTARAAIRALLRFARANI